MADIGQLVANLVANGEFRNLARNTRVQFGTSTKPLIGATILPNRTVLQNEYTEDEVRFRTTIANHATRYSPVQRKGQDAYVALKVGLGNMDIGRELTGQQYDTIVALLGQKLDMEAAATAIKWVDVAINRALAELEEKERWDAIHDAAVIRKGDNNYQETVPFPNPSGHRVTVASPWSDPTVDPMIDVFAMADKLRDKGYRIRRIIGGNVAIRLLSSNPKVMARLSGQAILPSGASLLDDRTSLARVNAYIAEEELPPIERYTTGYKNQIGQSFPFIPQNSLIFIGETDRTEEIDLGDNQIMEVQSTLGYYGIGRAVGQPDSGRVINVYSKTEKPPRLSAEGYQTSFPVILEPEAIGVLKGIS